MFNKIKKAFSGTEDFDQGMDNEYIEIDVSSEEKQNRVLVRLFTLKSYDDVTDVLNSLREGYTIAVIDVKRLRQKDSLELKRAISKIKKTVDAMEGDIKGFSNEQPDIIIATPAFARIEKNPEKVPQKKESNFY